MKALVLVDPTAAIRVAAPPRHSEHKVHPHSWHSSITIPSLNHLYASGNRGGRGGSHWAAIVLAGCSGAVAGGRGGRAHCVVIGQRSSAATLQAQFSQFPMCQSCTGVLNTETQHTFWMRRRKKNKKPKRTTDCPMGNISTMLNSNQILLSHLQGAVTPLRFTTLFSRYSHNWSRLASRNYPQIGNDSLGLEVFLALKIFSPHWRHCAYSNS